MGLTGTTPAAARVHSLHRYPVKSLSGQNVPSLVLDDRGGAGDRTWSVRCADGRIASGKRTRRFAAVPGLLDLRAREVDGTVQVGVPDGRWYDADDPQAARAVTEHVGRPVTLEREHDESHFDDGPVSLLALASVERVCELHGSVPAVERFRPNVVLGAAPAFAEEQWVGRAVHVGEAVVRVDLVSPRCVMVDAPTADLPPARGLLRALGTSRGAELGVIASVLAPGRVRVGDLVTPA